MPATPLPTASGLALALASAACFSLSGPIAAALLASGWTAGAAVTVRVAVGAAVLAPLALRALGGRWRLLRRNARGVIGYGLLSVAGCQLFYFLAVDRLDVSVALLIEYLAPLALVAWFWGIRRQRPSVGTLGGAALAMAGLALVLRVGSGISPDAAGVGWALLAMVGMASYFLLSASREEDLPPIVLATGGLAVGALTLGLAGWAGIVPFAAATADVRLGVPLPWWLPVALLGVVSAAGAYSLGIAAVRRLGARLASFVALSEVLFATSLAALLLGQTLQPTQLLGGALILAGVVLVRLA